MTTNNYLGALINSLTETSGQPQLFWFYLFMTATTFMLWGIDKAKAKLRSWRIPEKTLLVFTIGGGCLGAAAGMLIFRHKTRNLKFKLVVLLALIIHAVVVFIAWP